jgi:peptidoglycan/xylan/chitin deacetylase (PgdA/CDA1 family)
MIPILMYHQIDAIPPKVDSKGVRAKHRSLIVSPADFARQMGLLHLLGYRGVSMSQLMPYLTNESTRRNPNKVIGITFDDGYENNLIHALPVLQRYGFSSTCYAVSQRVGQTNAWDAADAFSGVKSKRLMSARGLREWIAGGQEVGSHTRHHVHLNGINDEVAQTEIMQSKRELEDITGEACDHFCYPYGEYSERHVAMVQAAGFMSSTTTKHRRAQVNDSWLTLPRIGVMRQTNLFQLWRAL